MTGDILLRGARLWGRTGRADVLVRAGVIDQIAPDLAASGMPAVQTTDLLLLPAFVDAHCHLDKTLYGGPWVPHAAEDNLGSRIATEQRRRAELGVPDVDRMTALLRQFIHTGTGHVRTHTDVTPAAGLSGIHAVAEAATRLDGQITVEQVAFPQLGILNAPGTADLLEEALASGVRVLGGIDPAGMDRDPVRHLDAVFDCAVRHSAAIDFHLHDPGDLGAWEIDLIAHRTQTLGLQGRVTISHAYALGQVEPQRRAALLDLLAKSGIGLVTAAVYSFPVVPLKEAIAAGVTVAVGHDGIRDQWGPYGTGDMLDRTMHLAYRSGFRRDEDIELALRAATYGGARILGLADYGLVPGAPGDLVAVAASTAAEAVVTRPERKLVVKAGRIVSGTLAPTAPAA